MSIDVIQDISGFVFVFEILVKSKREILIINLLLFHVADTERYSEQGIWV